MQRLNRALEQIDDSGGYRDNAQYDLRTLHIQALTSIGWSPEQRAEHLLEVTLEDQWDQFSGVPHDYADALGAAGLDAFYAAVERRLDQLPSVKRTAKSENKWPHRRLIHYLMKRAEQQQDWDAMIALEKRTATTDIDFTRIASLCLRKTDPAGAAEWLTKADAIDPNNKCRRMADWAAVHAQRGEWEAAVASQEAVFKQKADYDAYRRLMEYATQAGQAAAVREASVAYLQKGNPKGWWSDENHAYTLAQIFHDEHNWPALKETAVNRIKNPKRLLDAARWLADPAPGEAIHVYEQSVNAFVGEKKKRSYQTAARVLIESRPAFDAVSASAFDPDTVRRLERGLAVGAGSRQPHGQDAFVEVPAIRSTARTRAWRSAVRFREDHRGDDPADAPTVDAQDATSLPHGARGRGYLAVQPAWTHRRPIGPAHPIGQSLPGLVRIEGYGKTDDTCHWTCAVDHLSARTVRTWPTMPPMEGAGDLLRKPLGWGGVLLAGVLGTIMTFSYLGGFLDPVRHLEGLDVASSTGISPSRSPATDRRRRPSGREPARPGPQGGRLRRLSDASCRSSAIRDNDVIGAIDIRPHFSAAIGDVGVTSGTGGPGSPIQLLSNDGAGLFQSQVFDRVTQEVEVEVNEAANERLVDVLADVGVRSTRREPRLGRPCRDRRPRRDHRHRTHRAWPGTVLHRGDGDPHRLPRRQRDQPDGRRHCAARSTWSCSASRCTSRPSRNGRSPPGSPRSPSPRAGAALGGFCVAFVAVVVLRMPTIGFWETAGLARSGRIAIAMVTIIFLTLFGIGGELLGVLFTTIFGVPAALGVYPVEALPPFFRFVSAWHPMHYLTDGVRAQIFYEGRAAAGLRHAVVVLLLWIIGALIVGYLSARLIERRGAQVGMTVKDKTHRHRKHGRPGKLPTTSATRPLRPSTRRISSQSRPEAARDEAPPEGGASIRFRCRRRQAGARSPTAPVPVSASSGWIVGSKPSITRNTMPFSPVSDRRRSRR